MNMIGLNKRDIKKALKAGAKAGGVSLADVLPSFLSSIPFEKPDTPHRSLPKSGSILPETP